MTASEYIQSILKTKDNLSKEDHTICRSLMTTMPKAELEQLYGTGPLDWYLQTQAESLLATPVADMPAKTHNRKYSDYLASMKARKNVQASRESLRLGFDHFEWRAQRAILKYFLTNNLKTDRIWALHKMEHEFSIIADTRANERKEWLDLIFALWQQHHDQPAAWIIIKHFPYDTIADNAEKLIEQCGYPPIALRLGTNPDYSIDMNRLSEIDQLYVTAKLHRPIDDEHAESLLSKIIINELSYQSEDTPNDFISITSLHDVRLAIWCLGQLGKSDIIIRFHECDRALNSEIEKKWSNDRKSPDFYNWVILNVPKYFPKVNHQQQLLFNSIVNNCPTLKDLDDEFYFSLKQ